MEPRLTLKRVIKLLGKAEVMLDELPDSRSASIAKRLSSIELLLRGQLVTLRQNAHNDARRNKYDAERAAYKNAESRCTRPSSPAWKHYGGRGIEFRFLCFEQFFSELGPRPSPKHSLDRFPNNDGHYEPGNVRWATAKEQNANTRPRLLMARFYPADQATVN